MEDIERIVVLRSYAESLVLEARLEELGIPFLMRPFGDPAFGSFWRKEEGWGVLLAPSQHREAILEAYRDISEHEE